MFLILISVYYRYSIQIMAKKLNERFQNLTAALWFYVISYFLLVKLKQYLIFAAFWCFFNF